MVREMLDRLLAGERTLASLQGDRLAKPIPKRFRNSGFHFLFDFAVETCHHAGHSASLFAAPSGSVAASEVSNYLFLGGLP